MSTFKSVVTTLGQARIAAAIAAGTDINITQLAVGDGNGKATTPVASQTKLVKEVYRTPLNSLKLDPSHGNWVIAEAMLSASVGGFWMREMGLFSSDGALIAVCNMADTYKPTLAEGSGRTQTLRMVIAVSNTEAISLLIDDSVIMATEQYVNDLLAAHEKSRNHPDGTTAAKGFVQLSSSVSSTSEALAATPKAVKTANDNANGRLPSGGTAVAANKLATARKIAGVPFDGTADITISPENVGALPSGGTAVAANKLATARKIAGVAFDGAADITISPENVGALPSGGTAVAANKLATARKIAGVEFDGTKDISLSAADVGAFSINGGEVNGRVKANYTHVNANADPYKGQGSYTGWNGQGKGEFDFICNKGVGLGGFQFSVTNADGNGNVNVFSISPSGEINALGNVLENGRRVYSSGNPPPYPVTAINGAKGDVITATAGFALDGWHRDAATGMIMQWGTIAAGARGWVPVSFPVKFPTACANVQVTVVNGSTGTLPDNFGSAANVGAAGFLCGRELEGSRWLAIGW